MLRTCSTICSTVRERKTTDCQRSCQFIAQLYEDEGRTKESLVRVTNVTAVTRRTVRLKWKSTGMSNAEPVFFVIEAQWTLPREHRISQWAFLKEEVSSSTSILVNLQQDHRWYLFRVAAVTRHGSSAFVPTNTPLCLSQIDDDDDDEESIVLFPSSSSSLALNVPSLFVVVHLSFFSFEQCSQRYLPSLFLKKIDVPICSRHLSQVKHDRWYCLFSKATEGQTD